MLSPLWRPTMVAMLCVFLPTVATAQLSIDRGELDLAPTGPAQARTGLLTVRNAGTERVQGMVQIEDWDRAGDGANRFFPLGSQPLSCGTDLQVFPRTLSLAPGEVQTVRVEYTGGVRDRECTSLVVVQDASPPSQVRGALRFTMRMGLKVYVTPPGAQGGGDVVSVDVTTTSPDSLTVAVLYRNEGSRRVKAQGRLEVRRDDNSVVSSATLPDVYALPGATMRVGRSLAALPPGRYLVLAIFDYGGAEYAAAQREFEVR